MNIFLKKTPYHNVNNEHNHILAIIMTLVKCKHDLKPS